jgi:23S rRNA pseudouridine1911/1915/1917 synthase
MNAGSVTPNEKVSVTIVHEDEHLVVVNKRAGLVTQPGVGHEHDTLLNGLFATHGSRLAKLGKARDFGLVHRLDRDTSGLLVVGLTAQAYDSLRSAFESRSVRKFYLAICARSPRAQAGVINKAIAETLPRANKYGAIVVPKRGKISVTGKPATTAYRVVSASPAGALIEARPLTGRLHQVRVHLESIGCAILGDREYAPDALRDASPRLALHAHRLGFAHPATGAAVEWNAPMPKDLRTVLRSLGLSLDGGGREE